ncbi:MAG: NAD(P)/FAD-dependent oxidoreductase [Proteobacteria bacterium]|nr:NAD(P)/FAD-dependent oxidoreductase [Pseudomonadota bacterium]
MTKKTAIVIGSGMGGLTSAVLLGMAGYEVTVHEQHFRPGGLLHRFYREGAAYDTGFHYCGGIGHDDILGACLRHLGVFDEIAFQPLDEDRFDRLVFPDFEFQVPVGWARYRQALVDAFPHEQAGIDALLADMMLAIDEYGLYRFKVDVNVPAFLRWEGTALLDLIKTHVRDPKLIAVLCGQGVLYGVSPDKAPFGLHSVILHHFVRGAYRIDGGGDRLAKVMVQRIKSLGGTVKLKSRVSQVVVEDRKAVGVLLDSGEEQRADFVVSNMHPRVLLDHLPPGAVRKAYRSRVLDQRVGIAHIGVYVQLDGRADCIGNSNIYRHMSLDPVQSFDPVDDHCPFYFATAPNEAHVGVGKRRHDIVLMLATLPWERVSEWDGSPVKNRPEAYEAVKQRTQDLCVDQLMRDFPSLRGKVTRLESSTGLSTRHYTESPQGAMYGHYHSVAQMGRYRPSQVIRIRNFLQVGQGVFTPGVLGATLSAYYGCGLYLGQDRLLAELKASR